MNNSRRRRLREAVKWMEDAKRVIEEVRDEEEESYENLPEGLQDGDRVSAMQDAISELEDVASGLEDAVSQIEGIL